MINTCLCVLAGRTRRGSRCSGKVFLRPARLRNNLHVAMESYVTRVLIDTHTKTAYSVEFVFEGKKYVVRVLKEVILRGGSVNSPQTLMLSVIGLVKHRHQVLKVGHNLQDHIGLDGFTFLVDQPISLVHARYENVPSVLRYAMFGDMPPTLTFVNTNYANASDVFPDMELHFCSVSTNSDSSRQLRKAHGSCVKRTAAA